MAQEFKIAARYKNRDVCVLVVPTTNDLPNTARPAGVIVVRGLCYSAWRNEGQLYTVGTFYGPKN